MLDLIRSKSGSSLEDLEKILRPTLKSQVIPYSRDYMLRRFQDSEDLYNLALLKLDEAIKNFVYNPEFDETHNERRFLAMLRTYIRNAMIDEQWRANVGKRKPARGIVSFDTAINQNGHEDLGDFDTFIDLPGTCSRPDQIASVSEIIRLVKDGLNHEENMVFRYICDGYPAEKIAGILGLKVSRVRYILYEKIQPRARRYIKVH